MKYGTLSCFVYADSAEEADDLAYEYENRHEEDFDDDGDSGDTDYNYSEMEIDLEESGVTPPHSTNTTTATSNLPLSNPPTYFLAELSKL